MNRHLKRLVAGIVILVAFLIVPIGSASATDKKTVASKAVYEGVWQCLSGGAIAASFNATDPSGFVRNSLNSDTVKLPYGWTEINDNKLNCSQLFFGTSSFTSGVSEPGLNGGMIPMRIRENKVGIVEIAKWFAGDKFDGDGGVGYNATAEGKEVVGDGQKLTFTIKKETANKLGCTGGYSERTPKISLNGSEVSGIVFPTVIVNENGDIVTNKSESFNVPQPGSGGETTFYTNCKVGGGADDFSGLSIRVLDVGSETTVLYEVWINGQYWAMISTAASGNAARYDGDLGWQYLDPTSSAAIALDGKLENIGAGNSSDYVDNYKFDWRHDEKELLNGLNAKNETGYNLSGNLNYGSLALTAQEVFDLYRYYITDVFGKPISCQGDSDYEDYESAGKPVIAWNHCGTCRIDKDGTTKRENNQPKIIDSVDNLYGVDSSYHFTKAVSLDDIIAALNNINIGQIEVNDPCNSNGGGSGGTTPDPDITKPGTGELEDGAGVDCNSLKDIGAMQWVLCPVMNNEQYTASWIDNQTRDWLQVETKIYNNQTIKDTWGNIRNIANVIIMIILLVIIFSQVTGYGIDNYGIKRMLPKLIMMAVLVNLSFLICQILIDLSNITGSGLMGMLTQLSGGASPTSDTSFIGSMVTGFFAAGATGAPAAVGTFAEAMTAASVGIVVALVIAVIVFLLVVIIAVIVLFLMLGAREVIIVLCIILSPLAFAAYILPNTQNLAKKWWELFKAAIIIFPICGAMAGISNMLRAIYKDGDDLHVWAYAVLLILPYLGYFLVPILLKNALSALGKVGGALTALGNTVKSGGRAIGSGAMKVGQNTNAFKDWQERQQEKNAQNIVDKVNKAKAAGKTPSKWAQKRAYDAQMQLNKMKQEQALAEQGAPVLDEGVAKYRAISAKEAQGLKDYADQYAGLSRADMNTELNTAVTEYANNRNDDNALRLQAAIIAAEQRGMYNEMLNGDLMTLGLSGSDNGRGDGVGARDTKILARLAESNNKVFSQYGKQMGKKTSIDNNVNQSMAQFVDGTGNSSVNMQQAFAYQGSNVLNGMDDDTLEYISNNNHGAVSTQMLTNAAMNTTNEKELKQINSMLSQKATAGVADYEMKPAEFAKLNSNTVEAMNPAVYSKAVADIKNDPNSAANQQILNSMDQGVRSKLGLDDASLAQARNMQPGYANKTSDDVRDEAEAEYKRIEAQKKAEMDRLHGEALEENKEFDRREAEQAAKEQAAKAEQEAREQQTKAFNRMVDSLDRMANNGGDNNSGEGFDGGAGI